MPLHVSSNQDSGLVFRVQFRKSGRCVIPSGKSLGKEEIKRTFPIGMKNNYLHFYTIN